MEEHHEHTDDQSHYEISLTAGQAFVAFVLLLLSLAASFAFGLMIGKGQADERLVVRKEPSVVSEASVLPKKTDAGEIVELGVEEDSFTVEPAETETTDTMATDTAAVVTEGAPEVVTESAAPVTPAVVTEAPAAPVRTGPVYAQLVSTSDRRTAETMAARLIDRGFTSAFVDRATSDKGDIYRVRVKFPSEADARAAEAKLREYSREVWITR